LLEEAVATELDTEPFIHLVNLAWLLRTMIQQLAVTAFGRPT
jgi:hypothetical protein